MERLRVGVLISGRGSNLKALLAAAQAPEWPAQIVHVISNVPGAPGLRHAAEAGIKFAEIDHRDFPSRAAFEDELHRKLHEAGVELVCLAGFMRLLTAGFIDRWSGRLINIHPSLLPSYKGLSTHERVLADGVRITGCTVHFVSPEMDAGPIIAQAAVPVAGNDTADSLAARVLAAEHQCYPRVVRLYAEGKVRLEDGIARVSSGKCPDTLLLNPA